MKRISASIVLFAVSLVPGQRPQATEAIPLPAPVREAIKKYRVPESGVSIYVQELGQKAPLLLLNADEARNPASTIKLLTTWLALEELGPAWQWPTEAYLDGEFADGTLDGDLILKGYGDPYLVTERFWWFQKQLKLRGLRHITGDLVIDNTYFDPGNGSSSKFDGEGLRAYNVRPDAFMVNFQAMNMVYEPDPANDRVALYVDPLPANLTIDNRLKLVNGGCGGYQNGITVQATDKVKRDHLVVTGKFGRACEQYEMSRSALTAPEFAYGVFRPLWEESGGTLTGGMRLGEAPVGAEPFFLMQSPPLADVITYINKFSNNVMARHLFLTLGAELYGAPGTLEKGRAAAADILAARGFEFPELYMDNGAGLSRATRISAAHLGQILLAAYRSTWVAEYVSSLSLAGMDGTMRKRFVDEGSTGRMHLKTGRLSNVFATAGYVQAASGRRYIVVVLQNYRGADDGAGEAVQAALLRWTYEQ